MNPLKPLFGLLMLALLTACGSKTTDVIAPATTTGSTQPGSTTTAPGSTTTATGTFDTTGQTLLSKGTFMNNVHTVTGGVSVYEKTGNRTLVFSNFSTDGGPDLRIYLAENTGLRNFIELGKLDRSGNFAIELPTQADPAKQRYVLIWCKGFSVLFGNAELK